MMKTEVLISRSARKGIEKAPKDAQGMALNWINAVKTEGIVAAQALPFYKDHALKGNRTGERAIRLSYQWRLIYTIVEDGILIKVLEVNAHDYRIK